MTPNSIHPQTASYPIGNSGYPIDPGRRFRSFEILKIARYSSGFKIAQAFRFGLKASPRHVPRTKTYHLWTDTKKKIVMVPGYNQTKPKRIENLHLT